MAEAVFRSMRLDSPSGPEAVLTFIVLKSLCTSSGEQVYVDYHTR